MLLVRKRGVAVVVDDIAKGVLPGGRPTTGTGSQSGSDVGDLRSPNGDFAKIAQEWYAAEPANRRENKTIEVIDAVISASLNSAENKVANLLSTAESQASQARTAAAEAVDKADKANKAAERFLLTIADKQTALDAFQESIREELKLQQARKLWTDSAEKARNAYAFSWAALLALLVVIPAIAIGHSDEIFAFFRAVSEAVLVDMPEEATGSALLIAAVSRLILITLPVALYVWLIKIVVRFNARSLLLMDDARQRNTMLETYLHLVEQDQDVRADRPLILEALFRRTPGHGPEAVEPVNLADVLKITSPGGARTPG